MIAIGFRAFAHPTSRAKPGSPSARAISPYERVSPYGIRSSSVPHAPLELGAGRSDLERELRQLTAEVLGQLARRALELPRGGARRATRLPHVELAQHAVGVHEHELADRGIHRRPGLHR